MVFCKIIAHVDGSHSAGLDIAVTILRTDRACDEPDKKSSFNNLA